VVLKKLFGFGKNRRIVYTLSGGAAYGYAHIGVLKFLEEYNLSPQAIVGTSMGAVVGGLYACGLSPVEIETVAHRLRSTELMRLFFPSFPRGGIVDSEGARDFLSRYIGDRRVEELPIDFRTVAVDIYTGEVVIFDHGPVLDAILASMSIPAIFNPYRYRGRSLVDGGVLNNLPWDIAKDLGDTHVVVNVAPHILDKVKQRIYTSSLKESAEEKSAGAESRAPKKASRKPLEDAEGKAVEDAAGGGKLLSIFEELHDKDTLSFKKLVSTLSRRGEVEEREEALSLPEVITHVMAIINEELTLPPRTRKGPFLYVHPNLMEYSLNDFHKAEEIISIGYRTAAESATIREKVERIAARKV